MGEIRTFKAGGVRRVVINALYTLYYETAYVMANILLIKKCIYFGFDLIFVHILSFVERGDCRTVYYGMNKGFVDGIDGKELTGRWCLCVCVSIYLPVEGCRDFKLRQ